MKTTFNSIDEVNEFLKKEARIITHVEVSRRGKITLDYIEWFGVRDDKPANYDVKMHHFKPSTKTKEKKHLKPFWK